MSRIEALIAALCPEGVEFKALGDVVQRTTNIKWSDFDNEEFKYIDLTSVDRVTHAIVETQTITSKSAPDRAQQVVRKGDVLFGTTRPMLKRYTVIPSKYDGEICSTGYCVLRPNVELILPNFVFHFLGTETFYAHVEANERGASYPAISDSAVKAFRIPVPPLEVQREIVRVLDTFTALEAELEAELEARRWQYRHYRDALLGYEELRVESGEWRVGNGEWRIGVAGDEGARGRSEDVRWATLGEICVSISAGGDLPDKYRKGQSAPSAEFPYPIYSNGSDENALYGYTDTFRVSEKAVTISARGTIGFHAIRQPNFTPIVRLLVLIPNSEIVTPEYLNYALDVTEIGHSGGSIPQLTVPNVKKIRVPIPPHAEQARIVAILDKFDALVNDLSSGLPAEITARRQQYEYYRDRLLSFEELRMES